MVFFRKKTKCKDSNGTDHYDLHLKFHLDLHTQSENLIKLGKEVFADIEHEVFADIEHAKKERRNYINLTSTVIIDDNLERSKGDFEKKHKKNIELLKQISKDYDRLQYLMTLVEFVDKKYNGFKPTSVTYSKEPSFVVTLGEQAKTKEVLEEIIEKYYKTDCIFSGDHAEEGQVDLLYLARKKSYKEMSKVLHNI